MTPDQRAELRRRQAAATALPWTVDKDDVLGKDGRHVAWSAGVPMRGLPNVAYIVAAANAAIPLLDELEAAEEGEKTWVSVALEGGSKLAEVRAKLATAEARMVELRELCRRSLGFVHLRLEGHDKDVRALESLERDLHAALEE